MKNQLLLILCLFITSCQTIKWAERGIYKRDSKYPQVIENICANRYKGIDSVRELIEYLPGSLIIEHDTISVDCDSAIKTKTKIVRVPYYTTIRKVDTIVKDKITYQSNKANEGRLIRERDSVSYIITIQQHDLDKSKKRLKFFYIASAIFIIGLIVILYFKFIKP